MDPGIDLAEIEEARKLAFGKPRTIPARLLLSILSGDTYCVPYRPRFARAVGSVTAAILLQQIIYWDERKGGRYFYKFKEPCTHALYKEGDSWTEELGFSRRAFDTARDHIALRKTAAASLPDTIREAERQGKPVVYWVSTGRVTHYIIIEDVLADILATAYSESEMEKLTAESAVRYSPKAPLVKAESADRSTETTTETTSNNKPPAAESSSPDWDSIPLVKEIEYTGVRITGMGKNKRFSFRCPACDNDVGFEAVGAEAECTCGEVYKLVKPKPVAKPKAPHGFKDPILAAGASLAYNYSIDGVLRGGRWAGFNVKNLAAWKELMLNSYKRAPANWERWLEHCKAAGDTGRGLVLHAFNGFKQQGGGPPPKIKQKEQELELTEEALGI